MYKIPKMNKQVQVYFNDANKYAQKFIFFINERSKYGNYPESIEEFLNESTRYIPSVQIMVNNTEVFTILNKDKIYYVIDDSLVLQSEEKGKSASLFLDNGIKLDVNIYTKKMPEDQSRILDYINEDKQFLEFIIGSAIIYLNKNCISKVISTD